MAKLLQGLRHAFAVDPPGVRELTEEQRQVVDRACKEVARRHLTTPALIFLEMSRPLNFIGSQVMHYFQPILSAILDNKGYEQFASFLEHRGSIEHLCRRIEHFEREYEGHRKRRPGAEAGVRRDGADKQPAANSDT